MSAMMKHIGSKTRKQKQKGPTDDEKAKERLEAMDSANKK
jgi:hypothetical protein